MSFARRRPPRFAPTVRHLVSETTQRRGLARAVDDLAHELSGQLLFNDFETIRSEVLDLQFGHQWRKDLTNPPDTTGDIARRCNVRSNVRAPGVKRSRERTSSRTDAGNPAKSATRRRSASAKSISPDIATR